MCFVSAEREQDRREVGEQQVLDHVEARHLLAERGRAGETSATKRQREPAAPRDGAPAAGRAGAALGARRVRQRRP